MPAREGAWGIYDPFETADREQIFVGLTSDRQWRRFCEHFARDDLLQNPAYKTNEDRVRARPVLRPEVAAMLGDPRLERSGWGGACRLPEGASRATSVLRLRVVDDRGAVHPEAAATLEAALHDSTKLEVTVLQRELRQAAEHAARQAREAAALAARIAAMEASRFWKLRNQWFRVKGWLGIGES